MSDRIQVDGEALSALMDGELSEFELRRLLARISEEPELLETWQRYNLARAVYQPEPLALKLTSGPSPASLSNKIMAAIDAEPPFGNVDHEKKSTNSAWTSQVARFAVAASVALAVFVGMQSILDTPELPAVAGQSASESARMSVNNSEIQLAVDADAQQRLNDYIRSVSIPSRPESSEAPYNVLFESPMLHPVSNLELIQQVERSDP